MAKETRVGTLVLAALVIAAVAIFLLGRQQHIWERKIGYELRFARTNGLQTGAPVSLAGLPVGSVEHLRFAPDSTKNEIVVEVALNAQVAPRIRTDTKATIRTLGLLGDKAIELVPGTDATADAIPAGGRIPSVDPTDYEAIFGQSGGDIVANVVEVTAALKDVLQTIQRGEGLLGAMLRNREFGDRTLESLQDTLANLKATTAKLDHVMEQVDNGDGTLGRLIRDPKLAASLDHSLQSIERVTRRLEHGKGAAMRLVEDEQYGDHLLAKIDRIADDMAQVAEKLNRGDGTLGKLINEPTLHNEATGLVRDVRSSWLVRIYEGLRGMWPSNGSPPPPPARGTEATR
jgi:phospholipid/cholesterol/gamma-HCH transport system substrate-binding protein